MTELKKQLSRIVSYRELIENTPTLRIIQRDYNMLPETLGGELNRIESKLLTDRPLDRDDRVFLNTFERCYKN